MPVERTIHRVVERVGAESMVSIPPTSADADRVPGAMVFGQRLRSLRQGRGWSQRELGAAVFFSRECVAMVERGLRSPSLTFVERAEVALDADGELFALLEKDREVVAHRRRPARRLTRRPGKIVIAAGRLHAAMADQPADGRALGWRTAFDDLHRALQDELVLFDCEPDVVALEQRCAELTCEAGSGIGWADTASAAALGVAGAGSLLRQALRTDLVARALTVAGQLAVLAGDALLMLGDAARASEWYELAETFSGRMAPMCGDEGRAHLSAGDDQIRTRCVDSTGPTTPASMVLAKTTVGMAVRWPRDGERPASRNTTRRQSWPPRTDDRRGRSPPG